MKKFFEGDENFFLKWKTKFKKKKVFLGKSFFLRPFGQSNRLY